MLLVAFILLVNRSIEHSRKKNSALIKFPEKLGRLFGNEAAFGLVIIFVLVFGSISELLGFHFVVGAFFGALLIHKDFFSPTRFKAIESSLSSITNGFLGPIFFAAIGLEFSIGEMDSALFVTAVIIASIFSKIISGYIGSRIIGIPHSSSLGIGIILNGRGIMELVIASIAFQRGFIGKGLFSTLILMGVITTMITPMLFKRYVLPKLALQ